MHRALAEETDRILDPDRRSWHRAQAAPGPDDERRRRAGALRRSGSGAGRSGRGGGLPATGHGTHPGPDADEPDELWTRLSPSSRRERSRPQSELLDLADAGPLGELDKARISLLRAQLAFVLQAWWRCASAPPRGGRRVRAHRPELARDTYLDAFAASTFAGRGASSGRHGPRRRPCVPPPPRSQLVRREFTDGLLAGLAANFNDDYAAASPAPAAGAGHVRHRYFGGPGGALAVADEPRRVAPVGRRTVGVAVEALCDPRARRGLP